MRTAIIASTRDGSTVSALPGVCPTPLTILLDIGLPDMTGYELATQIRQHPDGHSVFLVALTGWGQEQDKADAAAAGFDIHLVKPVDYLKLLAILDRL
jgi:CheY-like chemotaxis protein